MAGGSILEVFGILFTSNADELKKGTKEAEGAVNDLEETLDTSKEASDDLGDSILFTAENARELMALAVTLGSVFATMASQASDQLAEGRLAEFLDQDIEGFHAMGAAIKEVTGDANAYANSLMDMRAKMMAAQMGDSGAQLAFLKLGIQIIDPKTGRMIDPADAYKAVWERMGESNYRSLVMQFGLEAGFDPMTATAATRVSFSELEAIAAKKAEIYTVTDSDVERSRQLAVAAGDAEDAFSAIVDTMSGELVPLLTKFLGDLTTTIIQNMDYIQKMSAKAAEFYNATVGAVTDTLEDPAGTAKGFAGGVGEVLNAPVALGVAFFRQMYYDAIIENQNRAFSHPMNNANLTPGAGTGNRTLEAPITINMHITGNPDKRQLTEFAKVVYDILGVETDKLGAEFSSEVAK